MTLFCKSCGTGQPLILLHGWGMHGGLFQSVVQALSQQANCIIVDLPGHGNSEPFHALADIDSVTDYLYNQLSDVFAEPVSILGWSMGSLIAQNLAVRLGTHIDRLVLIAGTPCFVHRSDWPFGIEANVLDSFNDQLLANFSRTLNRFLALQFMHGDDQKENLKLARELVATRKAPEAESLKAGLALLKQTDLREKLNRITARTLVINGERDTLIPSTAARYLAEQIPLARSVIVKGSGHAPFLSHSSAFTKLLQVFLA